MKYTVYQGTATWMRVTHEIEVTDVEGLSEGEIKALIVADLSGSTDKRVIVHNSTTPEEECLVTGLDDTFEFKLSRELTMDDYVHRYLKRGDRGHFAQNLGDAWTRADLSNRRKLEEAFPNIFTVPKDLT